MLLATQSEYIVATIGGVVAIIAASITARGVITVARTNAKAVANEVAVERERLRLDSLEAINTRLEAENRRLRDEVAQLRRRKGSQ